MNGLTFEWWTMNYELWIMNGVLLVQSSCSSFCYSSFLHILLSFFSSSFIQFIVPGLVFAASVLLLWFSFLRWFLTYFINSSSLSSSCSFRLSSSSALVLWVWPGRLSVFSLFFVCRFFSLMKLQEEAPMPVSCSRGFRQVFYECIVFKGWGRWQVAVWKAADGFAWFFDRHIWSRSGLPMQLRGLHWFLPGVRLLLVHGHAFAQTAKPVAPLRLEEAFDKVKFDGGEREAEVLAVFEACGSAPELVVLRCQAGGCCWWWRVLGVFGSTFKSSRVSSIVLPGWLSRYCL